jgi:hypothetical protein
MSYMAIDNAPTFQVRASISFPNFETKDRMSDKYSVQLANLSEAAVERFEESSIAVNNKDDAYGRGDFVTCKSKFPIIPVTQDGESFEGRTGGIGYGSEVIAVIKPVQWEYAGKRGTTARIVKLTITNLVAPEAGEVSDNDEIL